MSSAMDGNWVMANYAGVDATSARIASTVASLTQKKDELKARYLQLCSGQEFEGESSQVVAAVEARWNAAVSEINRASAQTGVRLARAGENIAQTDRSTASIFT